MALATLKFLTKASIGGGVIYVTYEKGIWGDNRQTSRILQDVKSFIPPVAKEFTSKIKLPLPGEKDFSTQCAYYWNKGVYYLFDGLAVLPSATENGVKLVARKTKEAVEYSIK